MYFCSKQFNSACQELIRVGRDRVKTVSVSSDLQMGRPHPTTVSCERCCEMFG